MKIDGFYSEAEATPKLAEILKEENEIKEQISSDRISYWGGVIDETLSFATKIQELFNSDDPYVKRMVLQILGSDLKLKDKKLYLEAKSAFIFLRSKQNEILQENNLVGLKDMSLESSKLPNHTLSVSFGAKIGVWVGLQKLFNDQNEEAKLLAFQLELLKNHLSSFKRTFVYD